MFRARFRGEKCEKRAAGRDRERGRRRRCRRQGGRGEQRGGGRYDGKRAMEKGRAPLRQERPIRRGGIFLSCSFCGVTQSSWRGVLPGGELSPDIPMSGDCPALTLTFLSSPDVMLPLLVPPPSPSWPVGRHGWRLPHDQVGSHASPASSSLQVHSARAVSRSQRLPTNLGRPDSRLL